MVASTGVPYKVIKYGHATTVGLHLPINFVGFVGGGYGKSIWETETDKQID